MGSAIAIEKEDSNQRIAEETIDGIETAPFLALPFRAREKELRASISCTS